MRKHDRAQLRKQGFHLAPLLPVEMRVPADVWEKLAWMADEQRLTRPNLVRCILSNAVRNAKPPKTSKFCGIQATEEELEAWQHAADELDMSLEALIKKMMGKLARQLRGGEGVDTERQSC